MDGISNKTDYNLAVDFLMNFIFTNPDNELFEDGSELTPVGIERDSSGAIINVGIFESLQPPMNGTE